MDSGFMLGVGLAVANGAVCLMLPLWVSGRDRAGQASLPDGALDGFSATGEPKSLSL